MNNLNNKQARHWNKKLQNAKHKYILVYSIFDKKRHNLKNDCKFLGSNRTLALSDTDLQEALKKMIAAEDENAKYFKNEEENPLDKITVHSALELPSYDPNHMPSSQQYYVSFFQKSKAEKPDEEINPSSFTFTSLVVQTGKDLAKLFENITAYIKTEYNISDAVVIRIKVVEPVTQSEEAYAEMCV